MVAAGRARLALSSVARREAPRSALQRSSSASLEDAASFEEVRQDLRAIARFWFHEPAVTSRRWRPAGSLLLCVHGLPKRQRIDQPDWTHDIHRLRIDAGASRIGWDADPHEGAGHVFRFDGSRGCGGTPTLAGDDPGASRRSSAAQQGDAIPARPATAGGDHRGHAPSRS